MSIDRITLQSGYSISRVIKGGWHLAGGHGNIDERQAIKDMYEFVQAGVTTFDCADIYTGVEELIGKFIKQYSNSFAAGELAPVQVHTKYVPDYDALATLTKKDTINIVDRSLRRLGVDRLDLVQFAWWDYNIPGYIETAHHLYELQKQGKIRYLGVTNVGGTHLKEFLDAGVPIIANQVQYSVMDNRPEHDLEALVRKYDIALLCYGTVAGGFLSDRYLNTPLPVEPLENRSLVKYKLIIDEFGDYGHFQETLIVLRDLADQYDVGIAEVASRYVLQKPQVAAVIVGARNLNHLAGLGQINDFELSNEDMERINEAVVNARGPKGAVYELESDKEGKHGAIMRHNLNQQR